MKRYYVGMDVGSTYIKAALLQNDQVMDVQLRPTGIDSEKTVAELLNTICEKQGITRADIMRVTATGYGRRSISLADATLSEISAHALGIRLTAPEQTCPRLLIDIGGQDSKIP